MIADLVDHLIEARQRIGDPLSGYVSGLAWHADRMRDTGVFARAPRPLAQQGAEPARPRRDLRHLRKRPLALSARGFDQRVWMERGSG